MTYETRETFLGHPPALMAAGGSPVVALRRSVPPARHHHRAPVLSSPVRRRDIEGLRAVAILLVVLGHAGVPWLAGGYVGVDVFLVISGFLITSLLLAEATTTGTVSLARFYARRAVRLLPAATLVLLATLAGAWLWLSPVRVTGYAVDGLAAAFYATNIRLAVAGTDYFAPSGASPFQHYWSLAVEEQFYLLWPLLVAATWVVLRRCAPRWRRWGLAAVLAGLTAASFAVSVSELLRAAPWAYFGLHSRAWELGVGALLALAARRLARLPGRAARVLATLGVAAVLAAAAGYDEGTTFPGTAAVLPVLGTAAVIAAGCAGRHTGAARWLVAAPMQVLGRLSYGWYLWHWPVLTIAPAALGVTAGVGLNLLLCAAALLPAGVTYLLLENPVRRLRGLVDRPARGLLLGLALSAGTAVVAAGVAAWPPAVPAAGLAVDTRVLVAGAEDPGAALGGLIAAADGVTALPANLTPGLRQVGADDTGPRRDGCHLTLTATRLIPPCVYGQRAAPTTVVLFGDSHALQWFPAMQALAGEHGWRLVSLTRSACTPADIEVGNVALHRTYHECGAWRSAALRRIRDLAPQLVVVASSTNYRGTLVGHPADPDGVWRDGWARTLAGLRGLAGRVALLGDTPFLSGEPVDCLATRAAAVNTCAVPAASALRDPVWRGITLGAAAGTGAVVIDPVPWLCAERCPLVIGNVLVYRDSNHVSSAYAELLAPLLGAALPPVP